MINYSYLIVLINLNSNLKSKVLSWSIFRLSASGYVYGYGYISIISLGLDFKLKLDLVRALGEGEAYLVISWKVRDRTLKWVFRQNRVPLRYFLNSPHYRNRSARSQCKSRETLDDGVSRLITRLLSLLPCVSHRGNGNEIYFCDRRQFPQRDRLGFTRTQEVKTKEGFSRDALLVIILSIARLYHTFRFSTHDGFSAL